MIPADRDRIVEAALRFHRSRTAVDERALHALCAEALANKKRRPLEQRTYYRTVGRGTLLYTTKPPWWQDGMQVIDTRFAKDDADAGVRRLDRLTPATVQEAA